MMSRISRIRLTPEIAKEIESSLKAFSSLISRCAVIENEGQTVAYITCDVKSIPKISDLAQFLLTRTMKQFLPSTYIFLEQFPLTSGGDVDYRALPRPKDEIKNGFILKEEPKEIKTETPTSSIETPASENKREKQEKQLSHLENDEVLVADLFRLICVHLDFQTICSLAQCSKALNKRVAGQGNDKLWQVLLKRDMRLTDQDMEELEIEWRTKYKQLITRDINYSSLSRWNLEQLLMRLERISGGAVLHGAKASVVTFFIPHHDDLDKALRDIQFEMDRADPLNILGITVLRRTMHVLKKNDRIPPNGLIILLGDLTTDDDDDGVEIVLEPFKPLTTGWFTLDKKFAVTPLRDLFSIRIDIGFITMDQDGFHLGQVSGSKPESFFSVTRDKLGKILAFINQNQLRFFVVAHKKGIKPKQLLQELSQFLILKVIEVSDGGSSGFSQAVKQLSEFIFKFNHLERKIQLESHKFKMRRVLQQFQAEIEAARGEKSDNTRSEGQVKAKQSKICVGVKDTLYHLEQGTVKNLLLAEAVALEMNRIVVTNGGRKKILFLSCKVPQSQWLDQGTQILSQSTLLEWLQENKNFEASVEIITEETPEGQWFINAVAVGGLLSTKSRKLLDKFVQMGDRTSQDELQSSEIIHFAPVLKTSTV